MPAVSRWWSTRLPRCHLGEFSVCDGSTRGAARSSDASRTGTFKFGFGSLAACFADARPRAATRVRKLLGSRATILAGLSGPRLVPVTCGFADGA
jgi:hypothetical protein